MKLNKVLPFLLLLLSLSFISCGTGMGSDKETNNDVTVMNKVSILCTSDIIVPNTDGFRASGANSTESAETLSYIEDGKVKPFTFISPSKKTFVLTNKNDSFSNEVAPLKKFNNNTIAYGYDSVYQVTKVSEGNLKYTPIENYVRKIALIDLKTSEVYDLNEYSIDTAQSNKDYIFANSIGEKWHLYKISMETKNATPISIESVRYYFVYDNERLIEYTFPNPRIHYINKNDKPTPINDMSYIVKGTKEEVPNLRGNWSHYYFIKNNKDEILVFAFEGTKYLVGKLDVNDNEKKLIVKDAVINNTLNNEYLGHDFLIYSRSSDTHDRYRDLYYTDDELIFVYKNSNYVMRLKITDTINVSFYNATENLYDKKIAFNDKGIYFIDTKEVPNDIDESKKDKIQLIKKYDYGTKSMKELYQPSNKDIQLADTLCVTDDLVIFYEAISATEVVTYSLDKNGTKKQIASHQANVKQITKLDINKYL